MLKATMMIQRRWRGLLSRRCVASPSPLTMSAARVGDARACRGGVPSSGTARRGFYFSNAAALLRAVPETARRLGCVHTVWSLLISSKADEVASHYR
jgi:hypothetical protein